MLKYETDPSLLIGWWALTSAHVALAHFVASDSQSAMLRLFMCHFKRSGQDSIDIEHLIARDC